MEARVNQSSRYGSIVAFSGREYVKYEWRVVPAGFELEAARHPYLEVKQIGMDVLESLPSFSGGRLPDNVVIYEHESTETFTPSAELIEEVKLETLNEAPNKLRQFTEEVKEVLDVEPVAEPVKQPRKRR
jgi:hypothetical protein